MKSPQRIPIAWLCAAMLAAGCAPTPTDAPSRVPERLRVAAGETLLLESPASGVQIYVCTARSDDPARYAWSFRAPEADLFDRSGRPIGIHYAGPTWRSFDGSDVTGTLKAQDDAPAPGAIPWLLLGAKSSRGPGIFGAVTSIQRVDTEGGRAPAGHCGPERAGHEVRVAYRATYYFYTAAPRQPALPARAAR